VPPSAPLSAPDLHGILFVQMARTDGLTDRHTVFQGSRIYDYTLGQWTSPDPAQAASMTLYLIAAICTITATASRMPTGAVTRLVPAAFRPATSAVWRQTPRRPVKIMLSARSSVPLV
jgi:hypothetical protein